MTRRGVLALLALSAIGMAGCSINVKETSDHPAGVGDPLVLKGNDAKTKITPTRVIDPLKVGIPKSETRYVGIDLKIENVGKSTTAGSLDQGATVITAKPDAEVGATSLQGGQCGGSAEVHLDAGDQQKLCLPFQVRAKAELTKLRIAQHTQFIESVGEWRLQG